MLKNKLSRVAEAMCYWLWRLCVIGCGGYVILVAEAMWCWLWRLCGAGCGGYVVLDAEAMWCWLRRLCGAGCGGYVVLVAVAMWYWLRRLCGLVAEATRRIIWLTQPASLALAYTGAELGKKTLKPLNVQKISEQTFRID